MSEQWVSEKGNYLGGGPHWREERWDGEEWARERTTDRDGERRRENENKERKVEGWTDAEGRGVTVRGKCHRSLPYSQLVVHIQYQITVYCILICNKHQTLSEKWQMNEDEMVAKKNPHTPRICVQVWCQEPMCVFSLLPEHAFKSFPINESDLLAVVRELAEHRSPNYGQMD